MPTAMSTTFPRIINSLNGFNMMSLVGYDADQLEMDDAGFTLHRPQEGQAPVLGLEEFLG